MARATVDGRGAGCARCSGTDAHTCRRSPAASWHRSCHEEAVAATTPPSVRAVVRRIGADTSLRLAAGHEAYRGPCDEKRAETECSKGRTVDLTTALRIIAEPGDHTQDDPHQDRRGAHACDASAEVVADGRLRGDYRGQNCADGRARQLKTDEPPMFGRLKLTRHRRLVPESVRHRPDTR